VFNHKQRTINKLGKRCDDYFKEINLLKSALANAGGLIGTNLGEKVIQGNVMLVEYCNLFRSNIYGNVYILPGATHLMMNGLYVEGKVMEVADEYVVHKGHDGQWYFYREAPNHEIVSSSEGYKEKASALEEAHRQADAENLNVRVVEVD
jgi:uncharacterized protein YegP (UPF0339 family)